MLQRIMLAILQTTVLFVLYNIRYGKLTLKKPTVILLDCESGKAENYHFIIICISLPTKIFIYFKNNVVPALLVASHLPLPDAITRIFLQNHCWNKQ
jgi:hypothetical protein